MPPACLKLLEQTCLLVCRDAILIDRIELTIPKVYAQIAIVLVASLVMLQSFSIGHGVLYIEAIHHCWRVRRVVVVHGLGLVE